MIQKKQLVQFTVQNRTDCGIDVPIYKLNVFSINATTKYTWDVTTETITCGYGTIVIDGVVTALSWDGTILGLLTALNALNYGFFCSETVGGNTYIVTYDDTNVYGTLDLCFALTTTTTTTTTAAPTTTTTTTTTTAAPTTTTTTTTTTLSYVTFTLAYSTISGAQACSDYPTLNTTQYYATAGSTLTTGTIIFTDIALTTPAPNGFYSNGVDYWNTGAGSGNLQNQVSCNPTTTTTTTTTTAAPTTTTTTTTTTAAPTTTTTTTTTTASALRTFRINNTDLSNSITLDVQVDSVQVITPTLIPANSVITLTPQVNCAGFTNVTLEYQLVAGYTPTSASFSNGSGTYTGTIAGGFITFTGVDLTANTFQDLTVNP